MSGLKAEGTPTTGIEEVVIDPLQQFVGGDGDGRPDVDRHVGAGLGHTLGAIGDLLHHFVGDGLAAGRTSVLLGAHQLLGGRALGVRFALQAGIHELFEGPPLHLAEPALVGVVLLFAHGP